MEPTLGAAGQPNQPSDQAAGRRRWPWWKITLAVLFWPVPLVWWIWWVWEKSPWKRSSKIAVSVAVAVQLLMGYALQRANTQGSRNIVWSASCHSDCDYQRHVVNATGAACAVG